MSTSMREALKPCPFCGSKSLTLTVNEHHWKIVECDDCGMRGPCIDLEGEEYLARWNTRVALSSPAPDRLSEDVVRKIIVSLRNEEDDPERPAHSERKAGWHAAVDRFEEDLDEITDRLSRQPEAEPVAWQWKHHDPISGNVVWREQQFWNGHRSTEQRALYTSPRLDREKVKAAIHQYCQMLKPVEVHQPASGFVSIAYSVIEVDVLADAIMRETR